MDAEAFRRIDWESGIVDVGGSMDEEGNGLDDLEEADEEATSEGGASRSEAERDGDCVGKYEEKSCEGSSEAELYDSSNAKGWKEAGD